MVLTTVTQQHLNDADDYHGALDVSSPELPF